MIKCLKPAKTPCGAHLIINLWKVIITQNNSSAAKQVYLMVKPVLCCPSHCLAGRPGACPTLVFCSCPFKVHTVECSMHTLGTKYFIKTVEL